MVKRVYVASCLVTYGFRTVDEINHEASTPVYLQLANLIRRRIEDGTYAPGQRIPSEPELEAETGLARGTVHKAIGAVREAGLVVTVRGKGSYVVQSEEG